MNSLATQLKNLPDSPGIYLFSDHTGEIVYVGKATSLKSRVRSYFSGQKNFRPIEEMIAEVVKIDYLVADSVLEAIILEGEYIKKYRPKYNVKWRDDKSWNYLVLTKEKYPQVLTVREHELNQPKASSPRARKYKYLFGPYPGLNTKATLKILRRIFNFSTCKPEQKRPCLYYQMGQCLGVCISEISASDYNKKVIRPLVLFLQGKKKAVMKSLMKEMKAAAKAENFEEAARVRNQLKQLQHIQDVALLNESWIKEKFKREENDGAIKVKRIEGYDISNLGASGKVGSMVVFDDSGPIKSEYRKFNIKTVAGQNDVDCLAEVLTRRFKHTGWEWPQVVMVDGGWPQVHCAQNVFKQLGVKIPIVGIAKGPQRNKNEIILGSKEEWFKKWVYGNIKLLIALRDEAHRFAIMFQRSKRELKKICRKK